MAPWWAFLALTVGARRIIDTHVHNADMDLGIDYGFPAMFPQLNHSWSIADFSKETTASRLGGAQIEAILMTLEKKDNSRAQIFAEADFYQRVTDSSANATTKVLGFVGGVVLEDGAADTEALKRTYPGLLGVRVRG